MQTTPPKISQTGTTQRSGTAPRRSGHSPSLVVGTASWCNHSSSFGIYMPRSAGLDNSRFGHLKAQIRKAHRIADEPFGSICLAFFLLYGQKHLSQWVGRLSIRLVNFSPLVCRTRIREPTVHVCVWIMSCGIGSRRQLYVPKRQDQNPSPFLPRWILWCIPI